MAHNKDLSSGIEWRIRMADGSSEILALELGLASRVWIDLKSLIVRLVLKVWRFLENAWNIGADDPRKVIHCLKVGVALAVVSLFYYVRPLYEGVGRNAMWAVMTVVVVFENTVGATLYKSLNRACGTLLAASLAIGVQWIASQSEKKVELVIVAAVVFLLASAATFSRFIPTIKAHFDYGAMIFILTFSLISISGYRVEKLIDMAHQRFSTIIIGTSLCILISMLICPIWAGEELYHLINCNMEKLANSLDGCVSTYYDNNEGLMDNKEESQKNLHGYKCVLNSKAREDSMAIFARWEPAHGRFNFQHPWKQYLKIGATMRSCAYCIEALNSCINSENQAPDFIKKHFSHICLRVSKNSSNVARELALSMKSMRKSSKTEFAIKEMNIAVQELKNEIKSLPNLLIPQTLPEAKYPESERGELVSVTTAIVPLMEVLPLMTFTSLLIQMATRIEGVVNAVEELADLAKFKPAAHDTSKQNRPTI